MDMEKTSVYYISKKEERKMIVPYEKKYEQLWDEFVLKHSINGNFLQTRNFYNYHKNGKFKDASIIFIKNDKIAAVLPANETDGGLNLLAHQGSTFGGIVIGKEFANTLNYNWIFKEMTEYFVHKQYRKVELRMHNWLYSPSENHNELLDYYFQLYGFRVRSEVGFYMDLRKLNKDYTQYFEKLKKRKLKKAQKYGLLFKKITINKEIQEFYDVLVDNMKKFDTIPLHTCEELIDFKDNRLKNVVSFYGVYFRNIMIAGSMVFNFCNNKVFHTQYLASRQEYLEYCPNEFMYTKLIETALEEEYRFLSYGTATLDHGNIYNESLGIYKEGYNTDSYLNNTYIWKGIK